MTIVSSSNATRLSLLSRAKQRDNAAWSELVDLYGPLVSQWCGRYGLDSHTNADCVQEIFAAVAISLDRYQPMGTSGAFRGWLWGISRNKLKDQLRKKARQSQGVGGSTALHMLNNIADESSVSDVEPSESHELDQLIRRGLDQVRNEFESKSWQAFWRSAIDQMPSDVVASELGISSSAVRQYRSRILRRLRQQLGDVE